MDKQAVIDAAKRNKVVKVGFSLKLPKHLKDELDAFANSHDVSANSLIVSILEEFLSNKSDEIVAASFELAKNLLDTAKSNGA